MSDGDAMLLALIRRKGSPHALADWLLDHLPSDSPEPDTMSLVAVASRSLYAHVWIVSRVDDTVWLNLCMVWGDEM